MLAPLLDSLPGSYHKIVSFLLLSGDELIQARNCTVKWPAKVFGKALGLIAERAMSDLRHSTNDITKKSEIMWVLTIPAIWGNNAKDFM